MEAKSITINKPDKLKEDVASVKAMVAECLFTLQQGSDNLDADLPGFLSAQIHLEEVIHKLNLCALLLAYGIGAYFFEEFEEALTQDVDDKTPVRTEIELRSGRPERKDKGSKSGRG